MEQMVCGRVVGGGAERERGCCRRGTVPPQLGSLCEQCGAQALWEGAPAYSLWGYAGETTCVHEGGVWSDLDECQVRVAVRRFGCRNCGYRDAEATIEEQFIHIGNPKRIKYVL